MDRETFYAALRRRHSGVFGSNLSPRQIEGMEGLLDAFMSHGDASAKTLAYALATAYHETDHRMVPMREGLAGTDAGARRAAKRHAQQRGPHSVGVEHLEPEPPYHHVYYRRGHFQLIGKKNYERASRDAGVDLVKHPDKMLDPVISARVLFKGLITGRWNQHGKGLMDYLEHDDLRNARHTINIAEKWSLVAGSYHAFLPAIYEAGGVPFISTPLTRSEPPPMPSPETNPDDMMGKTLKPTGFWAALFNPDGSGFPPLKRTGRDALRTGAQ